MLLPLLASSLRATSNGVPAVILSATNLQVPDTFVASGAGTVVDRNTLPSGALLAAVQSVGDMSDAEITGRIEESANGSTGWATVGTFAAVSAPNAEEKPVELLAFTPTQRYARWACDVTGGDPSVTVSAILIAYR